MKNLAFEVEIDKRDAEKTNDEKIVAAGSAKDSLVATKKRLLQRFPKYASVIKDSNIIDGGGSTPGGKGCTDGKNIWLNAGMGEDEQIAVLAHEAKHIERGDCGTTVEDHELWNIATDAVINDELKNEGLYVKDGVDIAGAAGYGAPKLYKLLLDQRMGVMREQSSVMSV